MAREELRMWAKALLVGRGRAEEAFIRECLAGGVLPVCDFKTEPLGRPGQGGAVSSVCAAVCRQKVPWPAKPCTIHGVHTVMTDTSGNLRSLLKFIFS